MLLLWLHELLISNVWDHNRTLTTVKYMLSLLVHNLSRNIFLWVKFSSYTYLWPPPALVKNILIIKKNLELNVNKSSKLKNSIDKSKRKQEYHSHMLNKVNNFKIFRILNENIIYIICNIELYSFDLQLQHVHSHLLMFLQYMASLFLINHTVPGEFEEIRNKPQT